MSTEFYRKEILNTLKYFSYFKYPLEMSQIISYSKIKTDEASIVEETLYQLKKEGLVYEFNHFYCLENNPNIIEERIWAEKNYQTFEPRIIKTCSRLKHFPFIEFVGLTGSLSKKYAKQNADIDLFIVTSKNRLWICRTLLHLFKKLTFLKGSQHWYCMNYFIDVTALKIEEQNLFTAIELSSLLPLIDNDSIFEKLHLANKFWIAQYLPNFQPQKSTKTIQSAKTFIHILSSILSSDWLNLALMRWTDKKWRKKWRKKNFPTSEYDLAFKTRPNISKNHLHNYQKKLLDHIEQDIKQKQ